MQIGIPTAAAFILILLIIGVSVFLVMAFLYPNIIQGILKALGIVAVR